MTDVTNETRAGWARTALTAYAAENRHYEVDLSDPDVLDEVVRDFLCDLRHLLDTVDGIAPDLDDRQDVLEVWATGSRPGYEEEVAEERDEGTGGTGPDAP